MDWSNEFYVRIYVRDTTTWRRLGWDGQNVLMQLFRKVDRAGTVELDGIEPWEAVMLHCGAPEDSARRGMESILRLEVAEIRGDLLVFPKFMEAQEASKSDKLRAKASRLKKALGTPDATSASQSVSAPSQDVTPESRVVTPRHAESHAVTPRHSSLRFADPSLHSASLRVASPADAEGALAFDSNESGVVLQALAAEPVPDNSQSDRRSALDASEAERLVCRKAVRMGFSARWEKAKQPGMWTAAGSPAVDTVALWVTTLDGDRVARLAALERTLDNFFADPWVKSAHYPVADLAARPTNYLDPRERRPAARGARVTSAPAAPHSAFDNQPDDVSIVLAQLDADAARKAAR